LVREVNDPADRGFDQSGQRRLGHGRQHQRCHRDPQLGAGEGQRELVYGLDRSSGRARLQGGKTRAAGGREGELGRDEEAVGEQQHDGGGEGSQCHCSTGSRSRVTLTRVATCSSTPSTSIRKGPSTTVSPTRGKRSSVAVT